MAGFVSVAVSDVTGDRLVLRAVHHQGSPALQCRRQEVAIIMRRLPAACGSIVVAVLVASASASAQGLAPVALPAPVTEGASPCCRR